MEYFDGIIISVKSGDARKLQNADDSQLAFLSPPTCCNFIIIDADQVKKVVSKVISKRERELNTQSVCVCERERERERERELGLFHKRFMVIHCHLAINY